MCAKKADTLVLAKENQIALRKERITELEQRFANPAPMETAEYTELLHEIQKNYMIALTINSVSGSNKGSAVALTVIEKMHFLIDSIERKYGNAVEDKNRLSLEGLDTDELLIFKALIVKARKKGTGE